jgi:uncharacterized protein (DUF1684 family)
MLVTLALTSPVACTRQNPEQRAYADSLQEWRQRKDAYMRGADGPLTPEQRAAFHGLRYFAPRPDLVFEASLEAPAVTDTVRFLTSTNTQEAYLRLGVLRFEFGGERYALTVFRSLDGHLFLPFTDATSGRETYGAGRYVEPEPLPDGRFRIDLNHAYNPYCAYNTNWVCPIAPPENHLTLRVDAGERVFHAS